jgi:hypothetical protein
VGRENMSFRARYAGWCSVCKDDIEPGDEIEYVDDRPAHVNCDDVNFPRDPNIETPIDVCGVCFQAKATNGACGCE